MSEAEWLAVQLIVGAICGAIAALIADSKGRSVVGWFFGGFFLGIIGIVIVACLSNLKDEKAQQKHASREARRLREQLQQERLKNETFRQHATGRLDVHDEHLGVNTRANHTALPTQHSREQPNELLAPIEQEGTKPPPVPVSMSSVPPPSRPPPPPNRKGRQWYYEASGATQGPIAENELLELLRGGEINGFTLLWTQDLGEWKQARLIRPLQRFIQS